MSKPKLKLILTSIIRSKTNESSHVLNAPIINIFLKFFFLKLSEGLSTELFRQSNFFSIYYCGVIFCILCLQALKFDNRVNLVLGLFPFRFSYSSYTGPSEYYLNQVWLNPTSANHLCLHAIFCEIGLKRGIWNKVRSVPSSHWKR